MSKNILVIFGGVSPEHDVSIQSAKTIIGSLGKHTAIPLYITREGKWLIYDGKADNIEGINWEKYGTPAMISPDRTNRGLVRIVGDRLRTILVDVVFPVLHGQHGEDGSVQGLLELAGLPYVGCGVAASAIGNDKALAKRFAAALKIPHVDFVLLDFDEFAQGSQALLKKIARKFGYPCFVKGATCGSSISIEKPKNKGELETAIARAFQFSPRVLVERASSGREIEIGILGTGTGARASVAGEVVPKGEFYDYAAKNDKHGADLLVPADIPEETHKKLQGYALDIFRAIGGRGLARVDFFLEGEKILFSELNTIPGFTDISLYSKVWEASGVSRFQLIDALVEMTLHAEGR